MNQKGIAPLVIAIVVVVVVVIASVGVILLTGPRPTPSGEQGDGGQPPANEYVVKEYRPGTGPGPESPLVYGEINYTLKFDYDISNYSPPFRVRLWENREGLTYNTETVRTIDNYEYAEWNFGTEACLSKSGIRRANLYDDSGGPFVGENFGWFGNRWCQGRHFIDTENEVIKNTAADIRRESSTPYEVAKNVALWMAERLTFVSHPQTHKRTPSEVLDIGNGDCFELSLLYASICRAAGVPARWVWGVGMPETGNPGEHIWAEFYDGEKWIPVDMTFFLLLYSAQQVLGLVSDWFGFVDARWDMVSFYVEDASENSLERLYSDTWHFEYMDGPMPEVTRTGSVSIQKSATLRIYNTGRRELVFNDAV
jgi:transglutaminase-like putative cysteine protease